MALPIDRYPRPLVCVCLSVYSLAFVLSLSVRLEVKPDSAITVPRRAGYQTRGKAGQSSQTTERSLSVRLEVKPDSAITVYSRRAGYQTRVQLLCTLAAPAIRREVKPDSAITVYSRRAGYQTRSKAGQSSQTTERSLSVRLEVKPDSAITVYSRRAGYQTRGKAGQSSQTTERSLREAGETCKALPQANIILNSVQESKDVQLPLSLSSPVLVDSNKETEAKENTLSEDEDEPPATAADALKHGERFLRWLECCSDPSITAMQLLQFRYLLNNVKSCAQRRAANKTRSTRSRRK
ncbi:hypothetical protein J6590_051558 [Homalodisca vitripennis]|nr:hypothetical protein J6590_051558 [Homalodisca vitripennis]